VYIIIIGHEEDNLSYLLLEEAAEEEEEDECEELEEEELLEDAELERRECFREVRLRPRLPLRVRLLLAGSLLLRSSFTEGERERLFEGCLLSLRGVPDRALTSLFTLTGD
jgi:hypothetical protein